MRAVWLLPALVRTIPGWAPAAPALRSGRSNRGAMNRRKGAHAARAKPLDAWKAGDAKSLAHRVPPIRFADDDLVTGMRLSDYEIEEPDAPITLHKDVAVILSLRDRQNKSIRREARYQIATEPGLAVLRSDR